MANGQTPMFNAMLTDGNPCGRPDHPAPPPPVTREYATAEDRPAQPMQYNSVPELSVEPEGPGRFPLGVETGWRYAGSRRSRRLWKRGPIGKPHSSRSGGQPPGRDTYRRSPRRFLRAPQYLSVRPAL